MVFIGFDAGALDKLRSPANDKIKIDDGARWNKRNVKRGRNEDRMKRISWAVGTVREKRSGDAEAERLVGFSGRGRGKTGKPGQKVRSYSASCAG